MESFDMFLNGNFVALTAFKREYGVLVADGTKAIPTKWQSALFQAGQCGAFVGVFIAGPITNRIGYRWATLVALMLMNATIFISFFVSTPTLISNPLPNINSRPTRLNFSSSDRLSKVFPGECSLPTLLPTPVKLSLSLSVVPAQPPCR
jgi:MFS family permease